MKVFDEPLLHLRAVLEAIRSAHLSLKPKNCHFGYQELEFSGHVVNLESIPADPEKVADVALFPTPSNKGTVRRFLGLCEYYRRFVKTFPT